MKPLLPLLFMALVAGSAAGQQLNKYGRILPAHAAQQESGVELKNGLYKVKAGNLELDGNACFAVPGGYVTVLSVYETLPAVLRHYNTAGKLLFQKEYTQVLNLKLAADGLLAVFHDGKKLHALHLGTYADQVYNSSLVFAAGTAGHVAWWQSATQQVHQNGVAVAMPEAPHQLLYHNGQLLALARGGLYRLQNGEVQKLRNCQGTGFEMQSEETGLYLSERIENGAATQFRLYRSIDLQQFAQVEETAPAAKIIAPMPEQGHDHGAEKNARRQQPNSSTREPINGPLNFSSPSVPYHIGNSYGELQDYGGQPYLHPGIDVLGQPGQQVYAVKSGVVKAILTTSGEFHWRIAVAYGAADSVGYLYAHLEENSMPFIPGDVITAGQQLGVLVPWPLPEFTHIHFARIKDAAQNWTGDWWTIDNPLVDLVNHTDTQAPVFEPALGNDFFAFRNTTGSYLNPENLSGEVQIISHVSDICNAPDWEIDVYELRYSLAPMATPTVKLLDTLAYRYDMPTDHYGTSVFTLMGVNTIYSRDNTCFSIANYTEREYYQIITNANGDGVLDSGDQFRTFNTANYPDGWYFLYVTAIDASMNEAQEQMLVRFNNGVVGLADAEEALPLSAYPNPAAGQVTLTVGQEVGAAMEIRLYDVLGRAHKAPFSASGAKMVTLNLNGLAAGVYVAQVKQDGKLGRVRIVVQ